MESNEKMPSPIYYVTLEKDLKAIEINHFDDLEQAIGLAMSLHKVCVSNLIISVASDRENILTLRFCRTESK